MCCGGSPSGVDRRLRCVPARCCCGRWSSPPRGRAAASRCRSPSPGASRTARRVSSTSAWRGCCATRCATLARPSGPARSPSGGPMVLARETACLPLEDRRVVDQRLAGDADRLEAMGDREAEVAARDLACQLDPACRRRAPTARRGRPPHDPPAGPRHDDLARRAAAGQAGRRGPQVPARRGRSPQGRRRQPVPRRDHGRHAGRTRSFVPTWPSPVLPRSR